MVRDWESWFHTAAQPASQTEEHKRDRTEECVRAAITASSEIPYSSVKIYVKGSYKTNTNVRQDADVDVCVEWRDFAYVCTWGDTAGMGPAELGYTPAPPSTKIAPPDFRAQVQRALISYFGSSAVDTTGDKAIDVAADANTLDADVIPAFQVCRYDSPTYSVDGQRIFPKSGGSTVRSSTARSRARATGSRERGSSARRIGGRGRRSRVVGRFQALPLARCRGYRRSRGRPRRAPELLLLGRPAPAGVARLDGLGQLAPHELEAERGDVSHPQPIRLWEYEPVSLSRSCSFPQGLSKDGRPSSPHSAGAAWPHPSALSRRSRSAVERRTS